jgi:hypothetical protein
MAAAPEHSGIECGLYMGCLCGVRVTTELVLWVHALVCSACWCLLRRDRTSCSVVSHVTVPSRSTTQRFKQWAWICICTLCVPAGLEELWNNSAWQEMVGPGGLSSSSSPVMAAPLVDHAAMQQPGAGAKRGLLEAVLQLSVPQEVGLSVWLGSCWHASWLCWPVLRSCCVANG